MATSCGTTPSRGRGKSSTAGASRAGSSFLVVLFFVLLFGLVLFRGGRGLLGFGGQGPIGLEHLAHLLDEPFFVDDDPNLAAAIELQLAQALTAEKRGAAVANDGADV